MSREVVTSLYSHKHLISLIMLDRQRQLLIRTDVRRGEIWEWSDHTRRLSACEKAVACQEDTFDAMVEVRTTIMTLPRSPSYDHSYPAQSPVGTHRPALVR